MQYAVALCHKRSPSHMTDELCIRILVDQSFRITERKKLSFLQKGF